MNRLREAWKKDPWHPGRTIDLGEHEHRFRVESGLLRSSVPVAPAVIDWLRWRFRRLLVDRQRGEDWVRTLREEYPRRVRDAGPPPHGAVSVDMAKSIDAISLPSFWTADRLSPTSKRQRLDPPRAMIMREPVRLRAGPPQEVDRGALSVMAYENREALRPLLDKCRDEGEREALLIALFRLLSAPQEMAPGERWREMVSELLSRA